MASTSRPAMTSVANSTGQLYEIGLSASWMQTRFQTLSSGLAMRCAGTVDENMVSSLPTGVERGTYVLTPRALSVLAGYYALCILGGLGLAVHELAGDPASSVMVSALSGSIGTALAGAGLAYVRRLYKAAVSGRLTLDDSPDSASVRVGFLLYFAFRPLFGVAIAVLMVAGLRAGIEFSTTDEVALTSGFLYSTMVPSFFAGFSAGAALTLLEERGPGVLSNSLPSGTPKT